MRALVSLAVLSAALADSPGPSRSPSTDDDEGTPSDPAAKCTTATPSTPTCCFENTTAPVLGGIDMVDLASKTQGTDAPTFGNCASFSAALNNYTFCFVSKENVATFDADPWAYAPAWGGF